MSTDAYGQYWSPYLGMGNDPVNGVDPDGGFETRFGAWWYSLWHGGGDVSFNEATQSWEVFKSYSEVISVFDDVSGNYVDIKYQGFEIVTGRSAPLFEWTDADQEILDRATGAYWDKRHFTVRGDGIEPSYPETWLFPSAPFKGAVVATKSLGATYKATRVTKGLEIGKRITTKAAVQRLKKNQDTYSDSRSEAKSIMKKAKGSSTVHDEAHGSGYYRHFHDKDRTGGHSFYGPKQ